MEMTPRQWWEDGPPNEPEFDDEPWDDDNAPFDERSSAEREADEADRVRDFPQDYDRDHEFLGFLAGDFAADGDFLDFVGF